MPMIFGLDIGTTSIGFAVIDHDHDRATGRIRRLGVRVFPEARDPKHVPLNQERRAARLRRRQLRRRRERRRQLGELFQEQGLLPARGSPEWHGLMKTDPYALRKRAATKGEALTPHEIGRALYHLAQRRHFKGRDIDEISDDADSDRSAKEDADKDEKEAKSERERTLAALKREDKTLGAWLADRGPHQRRRNEHASRAAVEAEFDSICKDRVSETVREAIRETIFFQRPTFWRLKTLGHCRFVPGAELCPKGSWLSQQRRMLEKLNNLEIAGGNQRPLDDEERAAILARLQTQAKMSWAGVRLALRPLYKARGDRGAERRLKFNLEDGGEKSLLGNALEAKLADIFGKQWSTHPRMQDIRDALHARIWQTSYRQIGQRVAILGTAERRGNQAAAARGFADDFGITERQADALAALKLPTGWEPYSAEALREFLPKLEAGERFGRLLVGPDREEWRNATFPNRERPTGEVMDRLPSPANAEERDRMASLRNPTVARTRNELRKVVNNLIGMFGKPDLIRVELARDVGISKREREERSLGIRRQEGRRTKARKDLQEKGISQPSRGDVEKWMLWQECKHRCPYSGDHISFDDLFGAAPRFDVEHIWPRSLSLDDSYRNKTLCRRDVNLAKGNKIPFEYLGHDAEAWAALTDRLNGMRAARGGEGMSPGKVRRFLANAMPDDFASRQLNDTGYAARQAVAYLKSLWPDEGATAPVRVNAVTGRVTAHLRRFWGLNNILSDDGEKTRADHRHHAVDALVVACCDPGMTNRLSRYWQERDDSQAKKPDLPPPWAAIRTEAEKAVADIIVSHRVRKKVSGPLHKQTIYGDTGRTADGAGRQSYHYFVTRKKVEDLTHSDLADKNKELWPDQELRDIVKIWVDKHGGDPKKAFARYPKRGRKGPPIKKVRLWVKQQKTLMAPVSTGYADLGRNHHIAIYRLPNGKVDYDVISLLEASRRLSRREPVMRRGRDDGAVFLISLSPGDSLQLVRRGEEKIRVVEGTWADGRVIICDHDDATGETRFRPTANSIISSGARKLSVDPIGRVRPAND